MSGWPPEVPDALATCHVQRGAPGVSTPTLGSFMLRSPLRGELKRLCIEKFEQPIADKVGRRSVVAIAKGYYGYGQAKHKCVDFPRSMEIGDQIARMCLPAGIPPNFTHALIAATPKFKEGGIGYHRDRECTPGSMLWAIGLVGKRTVRVELEPGQKLTEVNGDYLATNGCRLIKPIQ